MSVSNKARPVARRPAPPRARGASGRRAGPGAWSALGLAALPYALALPESVADWAAAAVAALVWGAALRTRRGDPDAVAVVLGGCVLGLAAPDRPFGFLAFGALVPFLKLGLTRRSAARMLADGLAGGTAFGLAVGSWGVRALAGYTETGHLTGFLLYLPFALAFGARLALPAVLVRLSRHHPPLSPTLAVPLGMVSAELFIPSPYPWYLASTQASGGLLSQIADLTGPVGVSALIVLGNVALWRLARSVRLWWRRRRAVPGAETPDRARRARRFLAPAAPSLLAALLLLSGAAGYGLVRRGQVSRAEAQAPAAIRVALIQPVTPPVIRREDTAALQSVATTLERLAISATRARRADLLVFAESAAPMGYQFGYNPRFRELYEELARRSGAAVLTENTHTRRGGDGRLRYWRGALLLAPDGTLAGEYLKRRLVPFGESLPLGDTFPALKRLFSRVRHYERGTDFPRLEAAGVSLVPQICFEMLDASQVRQYERAVGGQVLINPVNDAWYGSARQMRQHLALASWRSIELRRPMVRAGNTGMSAVISATGRIDGPVSPAGQPWADVRRVPVAGLDSFYARFGDLFGWGCAGVLGIMTAAAALRRPRVNRGEGLIRRPR